MITIIAGLKNRNKGNNSLECNPIGPIVSGGERYGSISSRRERLQKYRTYKSLAHTDDVFALLLLFIKRIVNTIIY